MAVDEIYTTACIAGIETTVFGAEEHPGAPVVFILHGRGGEAAHVFGICRDLVAAGLIAITFDQRNHGKRLVNAECNGNWSLHHAADMYGNIIGSAMDVSLLIDLLPDYLGISTERVGMTGISMGGHATLLAMALDTRIAVGAPLIGGGDYRQLMTLRAADNNCPADEFARYFSPALQRVVEKYDPIHHADRFADRPLLLLNGEADTLVPITCNQALLAACRPHYTQPERLRLSPYPGIGHACPPEMVAEAVGWLQRWLLKE